MSQGTVSWDDIKFTVYDYSIAVNWHEIGAVYIFVWRNSSITWDALYVGQTENLRERLDGHEKLDAAIRLGLNQIHVCPEDSQRVRLAMESRLIERYRPPLNQSPGG